MLASENTELFSLKSCDRCFNWKKKCSKHLSGCIRCLMSDVKCTYLIPRTRVRRDKPKDPLINNKKEVFVSSNLEPILRRLKLPRSSTFFNQLSFMMSKGILLSFLMGITGLSHLTDANEDKLAIVSLIGVLGKFRPDLVRNKTIYKKYEFQPCPPAIYGGDELYNEALEAFLKYFNPFFPLFVENRLRKTTSRMIQLAVFAAGLRFLKYESHELPFIDIMHQELSHLVSKNFYRPNLQLIQAMFIINYFLYSNPIFMRIVRYSVFNLVPLCYGLGLHIQRYNKKSSLKEREVDLERSLTLMTIIDYNQMGQVLARKDHPFYFELPSRIPFEGHRAYYSEPSTLASLIRYRCIQIQHPVTSSVLAIKIKLNSMKMNNEITKYEKKEEMIYGVLKKLEKFHTLEAQLIAKEEAFLPPNVNLSILKNFNLRNHLSLCIGLLELKKKWTLKEEEQVFDLCKRNLELHFKLTGDCYVVEQFFILTSTIAALNRWAQLKSNAGKINEFQKYHQKAINYLQSHFKYPLMRSTVGLHLSLMSKLLISS